MVPMADAAGTVTITLTNAGGVQTTVTVGVNKARPETSRR